MHLKLVIPCALDWRHSHLTLVQPFPFHCTHGEGQDRNCSWDGGRGRPGFIQMNVEFVAVHASTMRVKETCSVARFLRLQVLSGAARQAVLPGCPLLLCCACISFLLDQASSFSKSAWFLIMFGLAFFKCILFQGIASTHFSFVFALNMLNKNHYYSQILFPKLGFFSQRNWQTRSSN